MKKKNEERSVATAHLTPTSGVPSNRSGHVAEGGALLNLLTEGISDERKSLIEGLHFSAHALKRLLERNIRHEWILVTIARGRRIFAQKAVNFLFGRKEIARLRRLPESILPPNGLVVVCCHAETAITAYWYTGLKCLKQGNGRKRHSTPSYSNDGEV
jgi:hypothetical protein